MPSRTPAVLATIIWGVLLVPGLLGALLSAMFFDAPGSVNNPVAWANAAIVVSFPVLCILSIAASWLVWLWRKRRPTRALNVGQIAAACLPLIPVVYVVAVLAIGMIGLLLSGQTPGLHSTVIKP